MKKEYYYGEDFFFNISIKLFKIKNILKSKYENFDINDITLLRVLAKKDLYLKFLKRKMKKIKQL